MLGLFNLGGGEIILILFLLFLFSVVALVVGGLIIFLLARGGRKQESAITSPATPPVHPPEGPAGTQITPRKCPKCGADLKTGAPEGLCPACLLQHGLATEGGAPPGTPVFTPPSLAELAKLFPQLEILEVIGQGGMGAVYKARQPALERFVALKILTPRPGSDLDFSGRFTREARALARLSHPNIVAVYDFGQIQRPAGASPEGSPAAEGTTLNYFIMEYVDGPNLRQVQTAGKLTPREALQIIPQICSALQFAHDEGIVHRDIKPENVLLDKKGRVKIADFGLAKILGQEADFRLTGARDVMGTPHYMAPEQVETPQEVDHRADIYSLGVVFYEMLTGELPLGKFDPPSHKVQIDVRLDDVVMRSLSKNPERRYQHVSEVGTRVETIAQTVSAQNAPAFSGIPSISDYRFSIRHCLSRAWGLIKQHFWPLVGANALVFVLLALMGSLSLKWSSHDSHFGFGLSFLLAGPLLGGLYMFFLKRMRGEPSSIETLFSGFSSRFLHLFLGHLIAGLLIGLGFLCLILPGIYLATAWMFTLMLIMDKGLDFWPAMELSRKMITKHWWKFLGFAILLGLLKFVGVFFCVVGFFITSPIMLAAFLYAYEDIFGANPAAAPSPAKPRADARSGWSGWKIAAVCGVIFLTLILLLAILAGLVRGRGRAHARQARIDFERREQSAREAEAARTKEALAPKTIVLKRAAVQVIDPTNDVSTVTIWVDDLPPGETVSAMVKEGDGDLHAAMTHRHWNWRPEHTSTSSGLSWFLGGPQTGYGEAEAKEALTQLQENIADKPVELTPGSPLALFSVTNSAGEILAAYVEFQRTLPEPNHGEAPSAAVHLRRVEGYSTIPSIDYAATVPPGYDVLATGNEGWASTFTPAGPNQYHSSWSHGFSWRRQPGTNGAPGPFIPPPVDTIEQLQGRQAALKAQLQEMQDLGTITVVLGKPKSLFSITNSTGEIFEGFLELVGPDKPVHETSSTNAKRSSTKESFTTTREEIRTGNQSQPQNVAPIAPLPPLPPLAPPPPSLPSGVIRPARTLRSLASTNVVVPETGLTPEEQVSLIEMERMKFEQEPGHVSPMILPPTQRTVDSVTGEPVPAPTNQPSK